MKLRLAVATAGLLLTSIANACQCAKVSREGLYCGYCSQVTSVQDRSDPNANHVFWCNKSGGCEDLGRSSSHCEDDPLNTSVNCAGLEQWPKSRATSAKNTANKPKPTNKDTTSSTISSTKKSNSASSLKTTLSSRPSDTPSKATSSTAPTSVVTLTPSISLPPGISIPPGIAIPSETAQPTAASATCGLPPARGAPDDKCAPLQEYKILYDIPRCSRNEFLQASMIRSFAEDAERPGDYRTVFVNQHGAIQSEDMRLLADENIFVYDPADCAAGCSAIPACVSFNIFFERLPIYEPDDIYCPNPRATVRIGCRYWDGPIDGNMASNVGGRVGNSSFFIAIAGSNAYQKYGEFTTLADGAPPAATAPASWTTAPSQIRPSTTSAEISNRATRSRAGSTLTLSVTQSTGAIGSSE